jgi:LacI family transcriptional regulator
MPEATIRDVARRARLSVATVSRALNGFDNVSEQARERVAEAVRELGYVPHAGARSLSLARTNAIGVVLPDLHGEFFSEIVRGMDREASRRGYLLLLSNLHARAEQAQLALRAMHGRVDGLIVMAPHLNSEELASALPPGVPSILINTRDESGARAAIHLDNAAGVRAVVTHLAKLGRKRLVHIAGPSGNVDADERAAAVREACAANGIGCEIRRARDGGAARRGARLRRLVRRQRQYGDRRAPGASRARRFGPRRRRGRGIR